MPVLKTSSQWLEGIKRDPERFNNWLTRQYVGETLAARRVGDLASQTPAPHQEVLLMIAADEARHAMWVAGLLTARGLTIPAVSYDKDRYWKEALPEGLTFDELLAAGAHAEGMRLERIRLLASDPEVDEDVRLVFQRILPDEERHEAAFKFMAPKEALEATAANHHRGMLALGLTI